MNIKGSTESELVKLGLLKVEDGTEDPRGTSYEIKNDKFWLVVDAWGDVTLARVNPDTDFIKVKIDDLTELDFLIEWIK